MSSTFCVILPSNTKYAGNKTNKYKVHLPKSLKFDSSWVCGLHSIIFPYSWPAIGATEEQYIDIFLKNGKKIRAPIPTGSPSSPEELESFLNNSIISETQKTLNSQQLRRLKRDHNGNSVQRNSRDIPEDEDEDDDTLKLQSKRLEILKEKFENISKEDTDKEGKNLNDIPEPTLIDPIPSIEEAEDNKKDTEQNVPISSVETTENNKENNDQNITTHPNPVDPIASAEVNTENITQNVSSQSTPNNPIIPVTLTEDNEESKDQNVIPTQSSINSVPSQGSTTENKENKEQIATPETSQGVVIPSVKSVEDNTEETEQRDETNDENVTNNNEPNKSDETELNIDFEKTPLADVHERTSNSKEQNYIDLENRYENLVELFNEKTREFESSEKKRTTQILKIEEELSKMRQNKEPSVIKSSQELPNQRHHFPNEMSSNEIEICVRGVVFKFLKDSGKFQVLLLHPEIDNISISSQLTYTLGFDTDSVIKHNDVGRYGIDMRGGIDTLYIYSNICHEMIVGDSLSSLMRIVSVKGRPGELIERIYDAPIFNKVNVHEINEIEVEIRTSDGRLVPFQFGDIVLTLIFKKILYV